MTKIKKQELSAHQGESLKLLIFVRPNKKGFHRFVFQFVPLQIKTSNAQNVLFNDQKYTLV